MDSGEFPPVCPECGSTAVEMSTEREYTGGGYADLWHEFYCNNCGYEWRSDSESIYA